MSFEREYYEEYWRSEGKAPPESDPLTQARLKQFLKAAQGMGIALDLGCGNGQGTRILAASIQSVVGLDISHLALVRAKRQTASIDYVQGACGASLPFAAESFDAKYSAEVIEHLLDPQMMFSECHRVLKPSGILFVTTPYHGFLKNMAIAATGFEKHYDVVGPHIRFFTRRALCALLRGNGFAIQNTFYFGRYWPLWMNMAVSAVKTGAHGNSPT